ncbi:MAG: TMEM175 family protein [Fimbriimonadaceae bacterium]
MRKSRVPSENDFRLRGKQHVTRLECFSDCVFAFALTLLVVSLEVPKSFDDLCAAMKGMVAFAFCFAVLFGLWSRHHTFFRRYALEDGVTKALTAGLLFVVLAYVYPLKFLSLVVINLAFGFDTRAGSHMFTPGHELAQVRGLFALYGGALFALSIIFYLFYRYALSQRTALELTDVEAFDTRWFAVESLFQAAVPVIATSLAFILPPAQVGLAGFSYCLYGVAGFTFGSLYGKRRRAMLAE